MDPTLLTILAAIAIVALVGLLVWRLMRPVDRFDEFEENETPDTPSATDISRVAPKKQKKKEKIRKPTRNGGCEHNYELRGFPPDRIGTHVIVACSKCGERLVVPVSESEELLRQRDDVRSARDRAAGGTKA